MIIYIKEVILMGINLADYYNEKNIELSEERIEELLVEYISKFPIEEEGFEVEINEFLSSSKSFNQRLLVKYTTIQSSNSQPLEYSKFPKGYIQNTDYSVKTKKINSLRDYEKVA